MATEKRTRRISIYRDGVWVGDGTIDQDGEVVSSALLGDTQDDSDSTYEAICDTIDGEPQDTDRYTGTGSVARPDGEYSWVIS